MAQISQAKGIHEWVYLSICPVYLSIVLQAPKPCTIAVKPQKFALLYVCFIAFSISHNWLFLYLRGSLSPIPILLGFDNNISVALGV